MYCKKPFFTLCITLTLICSFSAKSGSPYYKMGYSYLKRNTLDTPTLLYKKLKTIYTKKSSSKKFKKSFEKIQLFIRGIEDSVSVTHPHYAPYILPYLACITSAESLPDALIALGELLEDTAQNFNILINPYLKLFLKPLIEGSPSTTSPAYALGKDVAQMTLELFLTDDEQELSSRNKNAFIKRSELAQHTAHTSRTESNNRCRDALAAIKDSIKMFPMKKKLKKTSLSKHRKALHLFLFKILKLATDLPEALYCNDISLVITKCGQEMTLLGKNLKKA